MKVVFNGIDKVFDWNEKYCWSLIIESRKKMYEILMDLVVQLAGNKGKTVLSEDNNLLRIDKKLELLTQFIPFDLNRKSLLSKIAGQMQTLSLQPDYYLQTQNVLSQWEKLCLDLSLALPGDINFTRISPETLFKAAGIELENTYERLSEKLLDYFELIEAYEGKKLFVLVNLRSLMEDNEMEAFLEEILKRGYDVFFIENKEYALLPSEKRYIIDADLCAIC